MMGDKTELGMHQEQFFNELSKQKAVKIFTEAPVIGDSIDGPVVSIEKVQLIYGYLYKFQLQTARRMAKMMKISKDAVKTHQPVDGEAMVMTGKFSQYLICSRCCRGGGVWMYSQ